MRIAILGTRGVPPRYGGFETFAAELGIRLVERGHSVTVYCRNGVRASAPASHAVPPRVWRGVERIELPAIRHKYLETVSHAFVSTLHALFRAYDATLLCNAANAFVLPLLSAARVPVAINVDGIERNRQKWNWLGRAVYQVSESFATRFADAVIADAEVIADYYRRNYAIEPEVIPYGSDFPEESDTDVLERLGVRPRQYVLYVSRFEPENNPIAVRDAYGDVATDVPLVMIGDAPYSRDLIADLKSTPDRRILFPGAIYGADYRTLQRNALLYVQATEIGGTHPAMIEAMGSGGALLANDTPENREVGGDAVLYFTFDTLPEKLQWAIANQSELEKLRERARSRARSRYSWAVVTDVYERLFIRLAASS